MSIHIVSDLNALNTGLYDYHKSATQLGIQSWLLSKYKVGDYFVTLTFNSNLSFNVIEANKKVKLFLHKINRAIFGIAYDKKHQILKSNFVFEQNASNGWHIHMLMEKPDKTRTRLITSDLTNLIKRTWVGINWDVVGLAQKVDVIEHNLEQVVDYMTKQITAENQTERLGVI